MPGPQGEMQVWDAYPNLEIDTDSRAFYEGWLSRELRVPKCSDCGKWHMPPRDICPHCWSRNVEAKPVSGKGRVHLLMILGQGKEAPGVTYPYPVATIELAEQEALRFTTTVVGCAVEDVTIDMEVELEWVDRGGAPFPAFRPRKGA